ncbi:MAG: hypothetical protein GY950_08675 [bacterium]|nr:hypothetical protein [bacterium]
MQDSAERIEVTVMDNNILDQATTQLNRGPAAPYTRDYVGAVKLLENSGFSPFADSSPLNSTLNQVFSRFVEKTGLANDTNTLRDEFLAENPSTQRALGLYGALESTFGSRGASEQSAIVDFLNTKIDDFITTNDQNDDDTLTLEESQLTPTLFEEADANSDFQVNAEELQGNFYNDFQELGGVLNYFRTTPGTLLDVYG